MHLLLRSYHNVPVNFTARGGPVCVKLPLHRGQDFDPRSRVCIPSETFVVLVYFRHSVGQEHKTGFSRQSVILLHEAKRRPCSRYYMRYDVIVDRFGTAWKNTKCSDACFISFYGLYELLVYFFLKFILYSSDTFKFI